MVTSTSPAAGPMSCDDLPYAGNSPPVRHMGLLGGSGVGVGLGGGNGGGPHLDSLELPSDQRTPPPPLMHIKQEPPDNRVLSPCMVNSDSNSPTAPKKTRPNSHPAAPTPAGRSVEEEQCLICGDRASGYHYNALSCEGCKGFFRRSITQNRGNEYTCKNGGNCEMDMWMRRRCQYCRLRRCREAGMKEECLLSDDQCKARDARRKVRQKNQPKSQPKNQTKNQTKTKPPPVREEMSPGSDLSQQSDEPVKAPVNDLQAEDVMSRLNPEEKKIVEKLVIYQDQFELPSDDDINMMKKVKVSSVGRLNVTDAVFEQIAGMTVLTTHLVVEYAKHLPGFLEVSKEDQIALLKGAACDIMMIRTARRYDKTTDTIIFADGAHYTRDNMRVIGLHDYVDSMFHFCKGMSDIGTDNAEYALLTAICLMCERPGLISVKQVESIQTNYVTVLQNYVRVRRGPNSNHFAKVLMKLTELRTLSVHYDKVLVNMKVERGQLPPLLQEFFDV
uniref:Ecdysone receptor n=1 Tax=Platynereis dumerilii TaxID=6359 RepID=A0A2S1PH06_PLADU|nr:ecdysone receptor [Platynereis dumerilii]